MHNPDRGCGDGLGRAVGEFDLVCARDAIGDRIPAEHRNRLLLRGVIGVRVLHRPRRLEAAGHSIRQLRLGDVVVRQGAREHLVGDRGPGRDGVDGLDDPKDPLPRARMVDHHNIVHREVAGNGRDRLGVRLHGGALHLCRGRHLELLLGGGARRLDGDLAANFRGRLRAHEPLVCPHREAACGGKVSHLVCGSRIASDHADLVLTVHGRRVVRGAMS
mmetsp:Transcript_10154/g.35531  ORF Transcript_10154/g.35531 Transcript_10154/m.35531 type:complete len:218 (-) Transcript_10154:3267-3920(-)